MAPISWLTETAAAKLLGGLTPEQVQDLVDAGRLHEKWIGGDDHLSISAESVEALLPSERFADDEDAASASLAAEQPAPSYRGGPPRRPGDAMSPGYEDALGAYLDPKEPPLPAAPTPIADPVERLERLDEWADDLNDTNDAGDDEK